MNFDWTKPVVIDWTGRSGPLITEHDIKNSVIKRILRNQYCAPLCERQYLRAKPWWNPQDPYGSQLGTINLYKNDRFIPGLHTAPAYPQTSTLTKLQHHHGLRVLNAKYQNVQPSGYPQPSQKDHAVFEEIKELYEAEQKEYVKWAKLLWVNGDCIRALRPKPAIEKVYDAEFKMRMHEIQSMPQNYVLAAQIPLETKNDSFDLEHKGDLIDVNVLDLPQLDYPEEMESDFSILLKSCPVPEPCAEHPCKFVLPNEDSVSVLPLSEIHRELAQYAVNNGSTFVASENALRCLLETDRAWKIPLSVVEVVCPEYGDLRTVVVLGSEFVVQKESSKRRTYKAYKHLLQHTFAPSTGHSKSKTATNTPQKTLNPTDTKVAPRLNRCVSLDDDLEVSSDDNDDDKLLIDDNEPSSEPKKSKDRCKPISEPDSCNDQRCEPSNEQEIDECAHEPNSEPDILFIDNNIEGSQEPNKEFDQLLVANASKVNPDPLDLYEPNYRNDTNEARPSYSHDHDESNSKPDRLFVDDASKGNQELSFYEPNSNDTRTNSETSKIQNFCEPNYGNTIRPSYSLDEPNSSPDRLMVNYEENTRQPGFNQDFWKPNYNCYSDSNDSEDGNATNEPSNNIEEPSCSELDTDKLCAKLFQTNKDATPSLLEINQDASEKNENAIKRVFVNNENASQMNVDAAPSLFKTNDDSFEFNEDAAQSLFGTNEDTSESNVNRPKMQESPGTTTTLLTKVYSNGPITTDVTCDVSSNPTKPSDTNESTLASDEPITSDTNNSPNTLSPTKPCTISVRNLTGLLIFPNSSNGNSTKIPLKSERNKSVCGTDGNASGNNDTIIENSKAPYSRLGISGVITRNRRIVGANESSEKVTEATTRLGIPGKVTRNRHISLTSNVTEVNDPIITENTTKVSTIKPATRRRGRISNANAAEVIEHSETNKAFDFGANELEKKGAEVSPEIARRRSVRINKANVAEVLEPTSEINKARVIRVNDPIEKDTEVITNTVRRSVRISNNYIVEDIDPPTRKTKKEDVETTVQPIKNNSELSPVKPCSVTVKQDIDPFARKRNFSATNSVIPEVIELINEKANNAILKPNTRKPSITYTNTTVAEVNEPTKKTSEVPMKSPVRPVTRKQRISSINNEVAKVIEPINKEPNKASLKPNSRKLRISESNTTVTVIEPIAENTAEVINKSPSSCCEPSLQNARNISVSVPVSESGPRNICSIETEASCITNYSLSNEPGNKRVRKLRNREHDYNQFKPENARTESRKLSMTGIEHSDGISPKPSLSFDETNSNQHDSGPISVTIDDIATIPKNPGDRKLKFNVTASAKTEKPCCNKSKPDIRNFKPLSYATKSRSDKMNLFGDKSDNVELICNASCINNVKENMTKSDFKKIGATILRTESSDHSLDSRTITESSTMPDTRKLRFSEPTDEKPSDIENNSLKPFLEKSISESPKNGKRKLSFRDPLTSDPELDASFREADNEDAIAGFNNGVPVLYTSLQKNPKKKQKNNATCTYELRNKPKPTLPKKSKTTVKKDNIVLTEIDPPETQYNTRSGAQRRISYSNSDDSDYSKCSKSISSVSKEKNKTNKQKNTENVLRKNRSIPTRANVKESDDPPTNKTYAKDKATTEGIRRSRRLSVLTKENVQPISNITKTVNYNPSSSFGKITKDKRRRKSLPANIFSDADNMNRVTRSRSLNNFNDIAKTGKNKTSRSISRSKCTPLNTETDNSLKLTERTKRNLRRVFNSDNSETEQSEDETSECTQRYNRTPISSSCLEKSDSEINKRSNRYCTRSSSTASYAIKTSNSKRKACKNNENSLSERTKRHIRLSAAAAYSSCDETDKPNRIARKKTKIQPGAIRDTIDSSVNKLDSSSAMKINEKQSNSQLKTEVMDFTENLERKNNEMDQSTAVPANESSIATFEIKIDVFEETDESNDETMKVLHFTELNQMEMCEENSSYTEIVSNQNSQDKNNLNETEVEKSNLFYLKSNVMDVSDSDAEFYDSQSYTLATTNGLSRDVIDETIDRPQNDHELIKTEPDFNDTNATDTTSNDGTRPRKNSISEASDSSDYFDMNETDELNMFHFTATTETDSDESDEENLLIVENSQSDTAQTNTVVETDNNQTVEEQYPAQENDVKSSVTEQTKTRHIKPNDGTVNETNDMHQSVQSQEDKIDCNVTQTLNKTDNTTEDREKSHSSKVLSCHNEALDTNTPSRENNKDIVGVYNCTCKGTPFEVPPPRSFKKWQVRAKTSNLGFDMIVHSSHRARQGAREMVLEPIVEYQPELGGCRLPAGRLRALALALLLRHSAGLLNVRVDHDNGNVIVVDKMTHDEFVARHGDKRSDIADTLHTTLNQLRFLRPGQYVLAHDSSHGPNAMLYTTKGAQRGDGAQALSLHQENINMSDAEDAIFAKAPPELDSVLLPYHKFRSILPLAFTTHKNQVKEDKKIAVALAKAKLPPQAIQWPKKKKKNKKPRPDRPAQSSQQD